MKHPSIAISGHDLLNRVTTDSDTPWRDVIRWNCAELDELESLAEPTDKELARREQLQAAQRQSAASTWWVVAWPEHVTQPKYNSDANYYGARSEGDARQSADCVFGE